MQTEQTRLSRAALTNRMQTTEVISNFQMATFKKGNETGQLTFNNLFY